MKNILKFYKKKESPKYTGSIHQGQGTIKHINYKSPLNHEVKKIK